MLGGGIARHENLQPGSLAMAASEKPTPTPAALHLEEDESAAIDRIKRSELLTWIYGTARKQADSAGFMKSVCSLLERMQRKGVIRGFRLALTGGQPLPIVSRIELIA
jgi:hypothetical protein